MSQKIESTVISNSNSNHHLIHKETNEKKMSFRGGKWDKEEHHKFIEGLFIYGNQWKKMQNYIKSRSSIQVRSHSQKFIVKIKNKYIELYGNEELSQGSFEIKSNHIISLLSNEFECNFITNFCKRIEQLEGSRDDKLKSFLLEKKYNFIKTILNLMNNPTMKPNVSRKNIISENLSSPISLSSLPTEFETEEKNNEKEVNEYVGYKENSLTDDDLFKLSFNDEIEFYSEKFNEYHYENDLSFFEKKFD